MNKKIHTINLDSNKIVSTSDSDIIINNDSDSNLAGVTYPYLCWGNTAPFKLNNPM